MSSVAALLRPKIEPMPHQWATFEFLLSHFRCYNLSSCGSGKTLGAVMAIKALYEHKCRERILVIAPGSVIVSTWADHLEQFAPDIPVMMLDNNRTRKRIIRDILSFKGIVLINPDGLKTVIHELIAWHAGLVVIDELAGYYRNCKSDRWKAAAFLIYKAQPGVWAFTGTPITKNLMDSYAQCLLVNPDMLPKVKVGTMKYVQYRAMLQYNPRAHIWLPKEGALERVMSIMQPAIRFTRADVMKDIKTPILIRKQIDLTAEQKRMLEDMKAKGVAQFGDQVIKAKEAATIITKALQICLGEVRNSAGDCVTVPAGPRFQALLDMYAEAEETPLIVAVPFIHTIHSLRDQLVDKGHRVAIIYGDTVPAQRKVIIADFQAGQYDFLLCHPKTLAHGVTLTASHTVVWYGPIYDLELYLQLCDRIFRFGQTGQPLIVEFESCPLERRVYDSLHKKETLSGSFLELFGE